MLAKMIVIAYNLFEIGAWTAVLVLAIMEACKADSYEAFGSSYEKGSRLWQAVLIAQCPAVLDIIFTFLGLTRTKLDTVVPQVLARYFVIFLVFPLVPPASTAELFIA